MKIFSVYYTDKPGGFCKRLYRLLNALSVAHTVHYAALDQPPPQLGTAIVFHRIPFWTKRRSGLLFWGSFTLWCPLYLVWAARKIKPDCYVVFGAFYSAMLSIARFAHPRRIVLFLRSLVFEINRITGKPRWLRAIADIVEKIGLRNAAHVVCMTNVMKIVVEKFAATTLSVSILPNDLPQQARDKLNLRELLPVRYENIVLSSGVLDQRKNIAQLIPAWKKATVDLPPLQWALVIAGDGPEKAGLAAQCAALELHSVYFIGWVHNLDRYLNSVQLVVHPSLHEGISNALLEAAANKVPILLSDIPEHREIFPPALLQLGEGGWEAGLYAFLHDFAFRQETSRETAKCAEKFSFDWDGQAVKIVEQIAGHPA